jgi:hypothetical protein
LLSEGVDEPGGGRREGEKRVRRHLARKRLMRWMRWMTSRSGSRKSAEGKCRTGELMLALSDEGGQGQRMEGSSSFADAR